MILRSEKFTMWKMKLSTIIGILIVSYNLCIEECTASHTSMCLGLPVVPSGAQDYPQSLGIEHLFPQNIWDYFQVPIEQYETPAEILPLRPSVELYAIKVRGSSGTLRYLNGWLKVSVKLKGSKAFVLCAHDSNKMPVGQFSDDKFPLSCGDTLPKINYNIIPCGGVPAYEPEVPNCIVYVGELGAWNRSSPLYDPMTVYNELNFYWHFSQQICNLKDMIHFRGYFVQKESVRAIYHPFFRDVYISRDVIIGAADPPPKPSQVEECNRIIEPNNPPWVSRIEGVPGVWTWIYGHPHINFEEKTGCQSNYFGGRCVNVIDSPRGSMNTLENPKSDNLPKCQTSVVPTRISTLMSYDTYINHLTEKCMCTTTTTKSPTEPTTSTKPTTSAKPTTPTRPPPSRIPRPPTPPTVKTTTPVTVATSTTPTTPTAPISASGSLEVNTDLGRIIWGLRQSHGVVMIIITMFLSPVSILLARYFKESFMSVRIVNLQIWYFAHIHITILSFVLVVVGMICVLMSNCYIGRSLSLAAVTHRIGGWITIILFVFMFAFGGCRTESLLSVCTHWLFGICVYVFCYMLLWNAVYIPGSPVADFDVTISDQKDIEFNMVCGYLIGWIVVDVTIHIIMTLVLHATDSSLNLTAPRRCVPAPIPVIHKDTKIDLPGTGFRTMCFFIHGAISFIITIVMVVLVLKNQPGNRTFGPHYCTHSDELSTIINIQTEKNCWVPDQSLPVPISRSENSLMRLNPQIADYYERRG